MSLSNPSGTKFTTQIGSNFNVGGGQLGLSYDANVSSNTTLFNIIPGGNRYFINPTTSGLEVELPSLSETGATDSTGARHGYSLWVKNISTTDSFDLTNSSSVSIVTVEPGVAAILNASVNEANDWYVVGGVSSAGLDPNPNADTLQIAYDNSGAVDPQIQLDSTGAGLKIRDDAGFLDPVFDVADSTGAGKLMTVKNATAGVDSPAIDLLGGDSQASDSLTVGEGVISSAANTITLGSGLNAYTNNTSGSYAATFPNGYTYSSGAVPVGTSGSDSFKADFFTSADGVVVTGEGVATTVVLLSLELNTTYFIDFYVIGRDSDNSGQGSVIVQERGLVTSDGTTYTYYVFQTDTSYVPTGPSVGKEVGFTPTISGTDLSVDLTASNNITNGNIGTMDFRIVVSYTAYTV